MEFVIVNGVVCNKKEAVTSDLLWDQPLSVSQNIWFGYGGIPLLHENLIDLQKQLASLGRTLPALFNNQRELYRLLKRMLNKNKYYRSGHLHFQFFLSEAEIFWLVEAKNYDDFEFPFAETGLLAEISSLRKFSRNELNAFRCQNQMLWTSAIKRTGTAALRPLFVNEKEKVCEATEANIFLIKKGVLVSPAPETGCYHDVMRQIVFNLATKNNIPVVESAEIDVQMLLAADEIFLASETRGMEWILGIDNKRFVRNYSLLIHEKVDDFLKEKIHT